ncbi:MAG: A/G-specific adenine glycosylase, partial [Erysipelotrichaceae bacterium]|nr:A/G-specific adenine glycosylase [Erysipelotrichaceae bacterium]
MKSFSNTLLQWYDLHHRELPFRLNRNPYQIWISEIMAQQTRIEALLPYYQRFMKEFASISSIAEATEEQLYQVWQGLGYYSRVRNIRKTAEICVRDYNGNLPDTYEKLVKLPGIGPYTAAAISSICYGEHRSVVDGNVLRVMARFLDDHTEIGSGKHKTEITDLLNEWMDRDRPGDFNQAMMELGALVCIPNGMPHCEKCPLRKECLGYQRNTMTQLPVKKEKKARKKEDRYVLLSYDGDTVWMRRRPSVGILADMMEFPHETEESFVQGATHLFDYIHVFSHVEWHMHVYET